ncbi:MAG TPA: nucleotide disphospho-sugar-binding domain-containing protein [Solirubrobacteraceae bacterium]|jgi:MGT family glycosyltransferase
MARILAYQSPTPGHVLPSTGMLLELQRRGHEVHVRTSAAEVERLAALGLRAAAVDPAIEAIELRDWAERTQVGAFKRVVEFYGARAELDLPDMRRAIDEVRPDALVVDVQTEGAAIAAEASGLPWAMYCPYPPAIPSADTPLHGMGWKPPRGRVGRGVTRALRAAVRRGGRPHLAHRNGLRAKAGLPPIAAYEEQWLRPQRFVVFTAEPYEFPRRDWPANVRLVGPGTWEPPSEPPEWLAEERRPILLVNASTAYQNDEKLIATALQAFAGEDVALVATTAATDHTQFDPPPNARVARFLPHGPIVARAACVISHGGQGTTQRTLAAGVPACVVPFCRDQFDVARRVELADAGAWLHHKRLSPERLRAAVRAAMGKRAGAERVARAFAAAGGDAAAAGAVEELLPVAAYPRSHDVRRRGGQAGAA